MKKIRIKRSIMACILGTSKTTISLKKRIEFFETLKLLIEIGELNEENLNYRG